MADSKVRCPSCNALNRVALKGRPKCGKCSTGLPWIVNAGDAEFADAIDTKHLVLVDLWAPWCGPCRMVAPVLEELATDLVGELKVVKVNVDESPVTAQTYKAMSIPMLLLMRDGEVVDTVVGAQPKHQLEPVIRNLL